MSCLIHPSTRLPSSGLFSLSPPSCRFPSLTFGLRRPYLVSFSFRLRSDESSTIPLLCRGYCVLFLFPVYLHLDGDQVFSDSFVNFHFYFARFLGIGWEVFFCPLFWSSGSCFKCPHDSNGSFFRASFSFVSFLRDQLLFCMLFPFVTDSFFRRSS